MRAPLVEGSLFAQDYRIVRPLASGGMGAVYVAHQISTARERALKVMLPELVENDDLKRRFEQEARIGARIESVHVVEVVGAGVDVASGSPWLAMELLNGVDLATHLKRSGPLDAQSSAELLEQLAHAVGAAHDKHIVHRDLKPENVFLAQTRQTRVSFVLKVLDFGIAKLLNQGRTSATNAMGTPLWMAPEQTDPNAKITPAADVWAIGLIAFRLLSGKVYWKSAVSSEGSAMMILREMMMEPLVPASARSAELGGPSLPAGFDGWFAKTVARDASARFPDANAMWEALRPILRDPHTAPSVTVAARPAELTSAAPAMGQASGAMSGRTEFATPVTSGPGDALSPMRASSTGRGSRSWMGLMAAGGVGVALLVVVIVVASSKSARTTASTSVASASAPERRPSAPRPESSAPTEPAVAPSGSTDPSDSTVAPDVAVATSDDGKLPDGAACQKDAECSSTHCHPVALECISEDLGKRLQQCYTEFSKCDKIGTNGWDPKVSACRERAIAGSGCRWGSCTVSTCK